MDFPRFSNPWALTLLLLIPWSLWLGMGIQTLSRLRKATALTLRTVFHLALRQTEGFVGSLIRLMELDLENPDHTTLSRRSATVVVPSLNNKQGGPIHLVIDSTGLKMLGDGEWHAHKHKTGG